MAQTWEFIFLNVNYRATVYRTGVICIESIDISPTIPEIMYRVLNVTNQNNAHSMILPTDYGRPMDTIS